MTNEISLAFEHLRLSKSQQPNVEKRLNAVSEEWALNARSMRSKNTWKLPKEPDRGCVPLDGTRRSALIAKIVRKLPSVIAGSLVIKRKLCFVGLCGWSATTKPRSRVNADSYPARLQSPTSESK